MYHINEQSEAEWTSEIEAAASDKAKRRLFVESYQDLLINLTNPENYFPEKFIINLKTWQKEFDENEEFDPMEENQSEAVIISLSQNAVPVSSPVLAMAQ